MLVGRTYFDNDDLIDIESEDIDDAAEQYADIYHQIDEKSDMEFELLVIDDEGVRHKVSMIAEYEPRYTAIEIIKVDI